MDHPTRNCFEKFADISQKLVVGPHTNAFDNTNYKSTCIFILYNYQGFYTYILFWKI